MNIIKRCWAEVSLDALLSNLERIKKSTNTEVMCVVKANAYGHGDEMVVSTLEKAGVRYFAVASMNEAVHLRKNGCNSEILLLGGYLSDCFEYAALYDITLAVYDTQFAKQLSDFAISKNKKIKVHIKLNTGMTRIGFDCANPDCYVSAVDEIKQVVCMNGLDVRGAFTHFSVSDEPCGEEFTNIQLSHLNAVRKLLEQDGVYIPAWHTSNSGAIVNYTQSHMDMVRAGIILYGMYNGFGAGKEYQRVLSLKSVITQIREIDENTPVSYGKTFISNKKMKVATVSIGYADGYPRSMSNGGKMIVGGKYASIIGRVCMDQTVIDVTDIDCKVGDTVTIIGDENGKSVTANDIAVSDNTINYEIICRLSPRIPRVYIQNGEVCKITEYI